MANLRVGKKFSLLLYWRLMARYRRPALLLAILLLGLWIPASIGALDWPPIESAIWLLVGGVVSLVAWLFIWIGPRMSYVQARQDHLRLQTPIYRLKVSYRRIHHTRPIDIVRMFPPQKLGRSQRAVIDPFYGMTALGIDLHGYPVNPAIIRFFFNRFILATDQPGLVLLVEDWMKLSNQLSSRMDDWRTQVQVRSLDPASDAAAVLAARPAKRWWQFWR